MLGVALTLALGRGWSLAADALVRVRLTDQRFELLSGDGEIQPAHSLGVAPAGGVWSYRARTGELERINREGEPVELHMAGAGARFSVDEELRPVLLSLLESGHVSKTVLGPQGEVWSLPIGEEPLFPLRNWSGTRFVMRGPDGGVRTAVFREHGSYLAEYDALGKLAWRQSDVRNGRFAFEDPSEGWYGYRSMVAVEPGGLVFAIEQSEPLEQKAAVRLVRIDF